MDKTLSVMCENSVMVPKLGKQQGTTLDFIDDTVLVVYAAGPVTRQTMFEGLGFADALKR